MGAGTYPDPEVERYLAQHFVPVQYNVVEQPDSMRQFNSTWTPTLIVQDADGREHRRAQGYFDARRFLGEFALARLVSVINRGDFGAAQARVEDTFARTKGDPVREPEARYWAAVVGYKTTGKPDPLISGWNGLMDAFPGSEWAKRVEFLRG